MNEITDIDDNTISKAIVETDITNLVKLDLEARAQVGERKYGARLTVVQPCSNGISALQNAYEEVLDTAVYLKKALLEEAERNT
jgi:hypothetical protein